MGRALIEHLADTFLEGVLGESFDEIGYLMRLDGLDDIIGHIHELIFVVQCLPPPVSTMLKEILAAVIIEVTFRGAVFLFGLYPEFFISFHRLRRLEFPIVIEPVFAAAERKFRHILQLGIMRLGEFLGTMKMPVLQELVVRQCGDFTQIHPFALHRLTVAGRFNVLQEFVFFPLERIGQQIIDAFILCLVLHHVAIKNLDIDSVILQRVKILFEIFHGIEKAARSGVDGLVDGKGGREVIAVAVEQEYDLFHLADLDQTDELFRKLAS